MWVVNIEKMHGCFLLRDTYSISVQGPLVILFQCVFHNSELAARLYGACESRIRFV